MEELCMRGWVVLLLCFLFINIPLKLGWCYGHGMKPLCREEAREALLSFKRSIRDPSNKLSSWAGEECCEWEGVGCHNTTGHVLKLSLRMDPYLCPDECLGGEIGTSLLELKHLRYLDLSCNDFGGQNIPKFLGSIPNLRYLNLSSSGFSGVLPRQLTNLSKLHCLDIGNLDSFWTNSLYVEDLEWISNLTSLKFLDMSHVNLSSASNWLQVMDKLSSLSALLLSRCQLDVVNPLQHVNFSSLTTLDLSFNYFVSSSYDWLANLNSLVTLDLSHNNLASQIPHCLYHMTTLEHLDLGSNEFEGEIPNDIGNLTSITYLDLSYNALEGDILRSLANICAFQLVNLSYNRPRKALKHLSLESNELEGLFPYTLGDCKSLETLELGKNRFSGQIPISVGGMSSLSYLAIDQNLLEGVISEKHFANLTRLEELHLSSNLQLTVQVSSNWTPPFQLVTLGLGSCLVGPQFPAWLQSQKYLEDLNMSYAGISSAIPAWFWKAPSLGGIDLSHNQITGNIPSLRFLSVSLSSNNFSGPLPQISSSVRHVDLSNNLFRGSLSPMLCQGNREFKSLFELDVSRNFLSGEIPDCWMRWRDLESLELGNNNLTGHIPSSMGSLAFLGSLHLHNNHLSGNFPLPLKNCTNLLVLDLSENEFTGSIPAWVGNFHSRSVEFSMWIESFTYTMGLKVLVLRSNKLNGSIPHELCQLDSLQILDLGNNNLSGTIPRCFGNFSSMSKPSDTSDPFGLRNGRSMSNVGYDIETLELKGGEYEYRETLGLLVGIDLSTNNLSGEIPEELTALHGLIFLNMSANHLQGRIPDKIGGLTLLVS